MAIYRTGSAVYAIFQVGHGFVGAAPNTTAFNSGGHFGYPHEAGVLEHGRIAPLPVGRLQTAEAQPATSPWLRPPNEDGATGTNWNGTAGSRHLVVDDHPDTGPTDFLTASATAGDISFIHNPFPYIVPSDATNIIVYVDYYERRAAGSALDVRTRIVVGTGSGTTVNGPQHDPPTTWTLRTDSWALNPITGVAWTPDEVNGIAGEKLQRFGILYDTVGGPDFDFSSIQVRIEWGAIVASGSALLVGGGASDALGAKGGASASVLAAGGTGTTDGSSARAGDAVASGGAILTGQGAHGGQGVADLASGGAATASGDGARAGAAQLDAGGSGTAAGAKGASHSAVLEGGGAIEISGLTARAGAVVLEAGGYATTTALQAISGSAILWGGGSGSAVGTAGVGVAGDIPPPPLFALVVGRPYAVHGKE